MAKIRQEKEAGISIEHLIEHIKDVFKIDPLSIRGYYKAPIDYYRY